MFNKKLPPSLIAAAAAKLLSGIWGKSVLDIKKIILAVVAGESPERKVVDEIIRALKIKTELILDEVQRNQYYRAIGMRTPPLQPLKALLENRRAARDPIYLGMLKTANQNLSQAAQVASTPEAMEFFSSVTVGRRRLDDPRKFALEILEKKYLEAGSAKEFKTEFIEKLSAFKNPDGKTFPLEIYPYNGKTRNYNVTKYAELVSVTTTNEARTAGFIQQAKEMGTPFVIYNRTGDDYAGKGDEICAKIDGKAFSIDPAVRTANGKPIDYIFDILPGPYLTPHPYCRHHPRPIEESDIRQ